MQAHAGIVRHLDALGELDALLASANRAREIANKAVEFFDDMILDHHEDEERELFPTVIKHAAAGEERDRVGAPVERLGYALHIRHAKGTTSPFT